MNKENKNISRRKFLKGIIGAIILSEVGYVLYGLIGKKKPILNKAELFNAGSVSKFDNNKIYPFTKGRFYLSRFPDGGFLAISTKCTHLGCMVQSDRSTNGFVCPCHASKFNLYGEVLSPPATRALDVFPVYIEKGEVLVDVKSPIRRKKFEKSQLIYL